MQCQGFKLNRGAGERPSRTAPGLQPDSGILRAAPADTPIGCLPAAVCNLPAGGQDAARREERGNFRGGVRVPRGRAARPPRLGRPDRRMPVPWGFKPRSLRLCTNSGLRELPPGPSPPASRPRSVGRAESVHRSPILEMIVKSCPNDSFQMGLFLVVV